MRVSVLFKKQVPGMVPMVSVQLELRDVSWVETRTVVVEKGGLEKAELTKAVRAILREHGRPEIFDWS